MRERERMKRINDESNSIITGGLILLLMFIAVSCAIFFGVNKPSKNGSGSFSTLFFYGMVFGLPIAIAVGLAFLLWHRRKFGKAILVLDSFPVRLGEKASGSIEISRRLFHFSAVRICIRCEKVFLSHTRGESVTVLWRNESQIGLDAVAFTENSMTVPLVFTIPHTGRPTGNIGGIGGYIQWRLEVETLPVNGPHFSSDFLS
jgi:hypothetical protein